MTEHAPSPEQDNPTADAASPAARKTSVADLFARISVTQLTLAVLVAIFLWQWLAGHLAISDMRRELAEKIAQMDGVSKANQILLERSQDQVRELAAKMATLEAHQAEAQNQRVALEALYNDLSVNRDETALAEVEQLLLIAGQQLQLSANVKAALIAMQSADARLQRMDRPAFNGLRKAIGQDMDKLRALPDVDIAGINYQLDALMATVDGLPLVYQQRPARQMAAQPAPTRDETAWQKLLREIWQDAKQLVRIEDTGKAEIPLLPPEQEFFLRENLKLRLLSARLALLSRDEESFRHEMKTAQAWTARYFDARSSDGANMLAGLRKAATASIAIELPDISPSLQAVRNYRLTREGAALPKAAR
ncbi:MAG: uroporphyrinogen-III C-methyltransferase [Gallionella sp.]|jgi:uroporphyrin-3 C-methyltransferase|nr:uroporphyrinogen-III C-methyltransferase [Gallionella sp.]MCK9355343.1 uroporphyrinogen-III C-methyltransferase [Gallionella sp.]